VVAAQALQAEVRSLTDAIVAKAPVAIAMGKQLFYRQIEVGMEAAYADAAHTMACNMMDVNALEGVQAFLDKRPFKLS
jgi:enoyl-CoA hydratase/carnithine racemase